MSFVRFVIAVDDQWRVTVTHNEQPVGTPRQMERGTGGKRTWPQPLRAEQPGLAAAGRNWDPKELDKLQERIARRMPNKGDVGLLGAHLFDALLGPILWDTIKNAPEAANAPGVELALKFPAARAENDLGRLHWEMLRDAETHEFLARGVRVANRFCPLAITRIVPGTNVQPRAMNLPPRALFVVGCDLNDARIRPGAEFLGLLRQVRLSWHHRTFHPRVLVRASVEQIKEEVLNFQPDVVHFICHGTDDGRLEFAPEPGEAPGTPARLLGAQDVCDLFKKPAASGMTWQPTIVVLSTCNSAQSLTADQTAPLAARLVTEGVPVVVGMSGRVADQACRLFTRSFGEALCIGRPLVEATEIGRRAAFASGEPVDTAYDWALPTLFLPEDGVGPDFAATSLELAAREERIYRITEAFRGNRGKEEPCFAARIGELERAYAGLGAGRRGLLVLLGEKGFGCTRLMQEMVGLAVRDGHLPALVSAYYRGGDAPTTLPTLLHLLAGALHNTENFYLAKPQLPPGQVAQLFQTDYLARSQVAKLYRDVEQELTPEKKPTVKAMVLALQHDLEQLLEAARTAKDSPVSRTGRPVLFIDDLELLGFEFLHALFRGPEMLVGEDGLGNPGMRIPLVVAFSLQKGSQLYEETLAKIRAEWADEIVLAQFDRQHNEDLAAYRQVLLNPHHEALLRPVSSKRWIIRDEAKPDEAERWLKILRAWTSGIPADFDSLSLYQWVQAASTKPVELVFEANDDDVLKQPPTMP